jgi:hypothetical protein
MIILCEKHGKIPGELFSPDLAEKINRGLPISKNDYVIIDYEYLGKIAYRFHLSREVAARLGFSKSERLPLSEFDAHPEVPGEIKPGCFECFQELLVD